MTNDQKIKNLFEANKWKSLKLSPNMLKAGFNGVFFSTYAVLGLSQRDNIADILNDWAICQTIMADLRKQEEIGKLKDLYLLFIVPRIDAAKISALQSVCSDTHVCRKICIELGDRDIEEVLMETPFLQPNVNSDVVTSFADLPVRSASLFLSDEILQDLAKSSKERIIDRLINSEYSEEEKTDET